MSTKAKKQETPQLVYEAFATEEQWLEARRTSGIGASEVPIVLKQSPFVTDEQLFRTKLGLVERDPMNSSMRWGQRLEKVAADAYAEEAGIVYDVTGLPEGYRGLVRHKDIPWLFATPDRTVDGIPVQIKTTSYTQRSKWSKQGEPQVVPLYIELQVQAEIEVCGAPYGMLVVLIGGNDMRFYRIERAPEFREVAVPLLEKFWNKLLRKEWDEDNE